MDLKNRGVKKQKNGLNQGLFEYLELIFAVLLGPTNNRVQAHFPTGILRLCRLLYLLNPIYPGFFQKVPFSVVSQ